MLRRVLVACMCIETMVGISAVNAGDWEGPSGPGGLVVNQDTGVPFDAAEASGPAWGTNDFYMFQIPPAAFQPRRSATQYAPELSTGYIYRNAAGGGEWFWAPLVLPAGAEIQGMRLFFYDNNAGQDVRSFITRYYGDTTPGGESFTGPKSSGNIGYGSEFSGLNITIDYRDGLGGDEQCWVVYVALGSATDGSTKFRGVRLFYYLQISAEPATATFNDVPVGAFGFQHVEALNASGITAGCGGGNFCPNDPLTRVQMAIFLAKALGLHWNGNGH